MQPGDPETVSENASLFPLDAFVPRFITTVSVITDPTPVTREDRTFALNPLL